MKSWSVRVFKFQSDQEGYKQRKTQDPWLSHWHMYDPISFSWIITMKAYTCLFSCFSAVLLFFCNHCLHFFFLTYDFHLILIKVNWFERCGLRNDLFFCPISITFTTRNTPFDCNSQWQLLYEICGGNMWSQYVYISGRHEHIFSPNRQRLSAEAQQRSNNLRHMSFDD